MTINMTYGILGGDLRNIELSKLLAKEKNIVYTYGLEKVLLQKQKNENIFLCDNIEELEKTEIIVTSIPLSKDGIYLNMPLSDKKVEIKSIFPVLSGKLVFSGSISNEIAEKLNKRGVEFIDVMKNEEFAILNTIPTAEETIKIVIENTKTTIHNKNCLILGYGRLGKILAKKFSGLDVNVTCVTNDIIEKAWCNAYGYNQIKFVDIKNNANILENYDIIINTIPKIILKDELRAVAKDTLIIDLASKPYGIDRNIVKEENLNFIEALGLPGKSAPITVAENIKQIVQYTLIEKKIIV